MDYRPVFFHSQLSTHCARVRRTIRRLGIDVDERDVLLSRRNREELRRVAGDARVPCLLIGATVVQGPEEIIKYLTLRFGGHEPSS